MAAGSVEIFSASHNCWVVAASVVPAEGAPGRVRVEYVLGEERRAKTVRANDHRRLRPAAAAAAAETAGADGTVARRRKKPKHS